MWAFIGTHAAAFAVIQVRDKLPIHLVDAALGTIDRTEAAFYTCLMIDNGHKSPPGTGLRYSGAARIYQFTSLHFHQETLS